MIAALSTLVRTTSSSLVNSRGDNGGRTRTPETVGANLEDKTDPFPTEAHPVTPPPTLPHEQECIKSGTIAIFGVAACWQLRTLYVTDELLCIGDRGAGSVIERFKLVDILKVTSWRASNKVQSDEEVIVKDELDCCLQLFIQCPYSSALGMGSSPVPQSTISSPVSAQSEATVPDISDKALLTPARYDKHNVQIVCLRALSSDEREDWERVLRDCVGRAKAAEIAARLPPTWQENLSDKYNSNISQTIVMTLVVVNFCISIAEAELVPEPGSQLDITLESIDLTFTVIFGIELAINLTAHWFWEFWRNSWNWLDFLVVLVSLGSIGTEAGPTIKIIRILRALRVMRLIKRLVALRMIVAAIASSVIPVANVFFLLMLATLVYAILGVGLFRDDSPEFFGNLSRAFFTMFQCVTGDGWASSVARPMMLSKYPEAHGQDGEKQELFGYEPGLALYFYSYIVLVSWIIVNVVLAVLLDEFLKSSGDEKLKIKEETETLEDLAEIKGPLDPLLQKLACFRSGDDLFRSVASIFASFSCATDCSDPDSRITVSSICQGLQLLNVTPRLKVSKETLLELWHVFSIGSASRYGCNYSSKESSPAEIIRDEGMTGMEFERLMIWQLGKYIERKASKIVNEVDRLDPVAGVTLQMLKYLLTQTSLNSESNGSAEHLGGLSCGVIGPELPRRERNLERKVDALVAQQGEILRALASLVEVKGMTARQDPQKQRIPSSSLPFALSDKPPSSALKPKAGKIRPVHTGNAVDAREDQLTEDDKQCVEERTLRKKDLHPQIASMQSAIEEGKQRERLKKLQQKPPAYSVPPPPTGQLWLARHQQQQEEREARPEEDDDFEYRAVDHDDSGSGTFESSRGNAPSPRHFSLSDRALKREAVPSRSLGAPPLWSASALGTDFSRVGELLPWKKSPLKASDSNNLGKEPEADHANSTNFSHKTGDTYGNVVASLLDEARHRLEARFGDTPRADGQGIEISSQRVESMGPMPSAR